MSRRRREEVGEGSLLLMRCFRAMTVVFEGWEMSRETSGIEAVKRTVMRRVLVAAEGVGVAIVGKGIQSEVELLIISGFRQPRAMSWSLVQAAQCSRARRLRQAVELCELLEAKLKMPLLTMTGVGIFSGR
jgi:hypothetical protein